MKHSIIAVLALLLFSCDNSEDYKNISGEWNCSEWLIVSTDNDRCKNNVYFNFNENKTYTSKIGEQEESGIYKISNGLLYSTPDGKLEIGVEINILNNDTLQFTMSRSGQKEIMTLLKKQ